MTYFVFYLGVAGDIILVTQLGVKSHPAPGGCGPNECAGQDLHVFAAFPLFKENYVFHADGNHLKDLKYLDISYQKMHRNLEDSKIF